MPDFSVTIIFIVMNLPMRLVINIMINAAMKAEYVSEDLRIAHPTVPSVTIMPVSFAVQVSTCQKGLV